MSVLDTQSFADFDSAAREVLSFLHQRIGFDLWLITRVEGEDWIVLKARDQGYGVEEGTVFRWSDSLCSQMVAGNGPQVAPRLNIIPAYANAPIRKQLKIGAYVGVPLTYHDGSVFGTLCAIHPTSLSDTITAELPLIELLAKLLGSLLNADLKASEHARSAERAQTEALSDTLTKVYNRRGWDQLLEQEEKRCLQYGYSACVIAIDLDGLKQVNDTQGHTKGDELICKAGQALRQTVRKQDVIARVGGDEFAVLCVECNLVQAQALTKRIGAAFASAQVKASLGIAARKPSQGLLQAWEEADQEMYVCKRRGKVSSPLKAL
ncbi:MAG TPA: sensor domain-containing diguanylate cyclase [Leptolyngbyaceae cyanobacterium]